MYDIYIFKVMDDTSFFVHNRKIKYAPNSLGMLTNKNPIRVGIVWLITWKWFDRIVIGLILFNSILLGIKDYKDKENEGTRN